MAFNIYTEGAFTQTKYDCYLDNFNTPSMFFHRHGLTDVFITTSGYVYLRKIELCVGDTPFYTREYINHSFPITANGVISLKDDLAKYSPLDPSQFIRYTYLPSQYKSISNNTIFAGVEYSYANGGTYDYKVTLNSAVRSTSQKTYKINVKITYSEYGNKDINKTEQVTLHSLGTIEFYPKKLNALLVDITNVKKDFELNEKFTYENLVARVNYKLPVCDAVLGYTEVASYSVCEPDMTTEGKKTVRVTYSDLEDFYTINVSTTYIYTLNVDYSSISNKTHYTNRQIDLSGITGTFKTDTKISSGNITTKTLNYNDLIFTLNGNFISNGDILPFSPGTYELLATYKHSGGEEQVKGIIVVSPLTISSLEISELPTLSLNEYIDGQPLNLAGLKIKLVYIDGSKSDDIEIQDDEDISVHLDQNGVEKEIYRNEKMLYTYNGAAIKIGYNGIDSKAQLGVLTIVNNYLDSMDIVKYPNKTTYTYGETFTLDGLSGKYTMADGSVFSLDLNKDTIKVSCEGISNLIGHEFSDENFTSATTKIVTITLEQGDKSVSKTYPINLVLPTLKSIRLDLSEVQKTYHRGDLFSFEKLKVYAVYESGFEHYITAFEVDTSSLILADNGTIPSTTAFATYDIIVTGYDYYNLTKSMTTSYQVTITTNNQIVSATLKYDIDVEYDKYYVGDTFDAKGIYIVTTDADGIATTYRDLALENFSITPPLGKLFTSAKPMEVSIIFDGKGYTSPPMSYPIRINVRGVNNLDVTENYKLATNDNDGTLFSYIIKDDITINLGTKTDEVSGQTTYIYPLFPKDLVEVDEDSGYNHYKGNDYTKDCVGYIDFGVQDKYGNKIRNAHVVFFEDVLNPIEGDGNITVKFPHYIEGYADRINKCKFGKIYNGRLFVSGNPNYKNCDWHSGEINVSQTENYDQDSTKDFTYFSDLDYCRYGSDDTAIVGYDIYRDGDLIVFKESSRNEATIYKRTHSLINAIDYAGNVLSDNIEESYPCYDINSNGGEGSFTNRTVINFIGDTLFLTKSGLKMLSSKETTTNNAKYSYDVSSYINTKITNEELENAYLYTFKERLILKTKRGVYYGEYNLRNENKEYEWYFLDNVEVDLFFEYDDELYFTDNEGNIKKFSDTSSYVDKRRVFIGIGGALLTNSPNEEINDGFDINEEKNYIIINNAYNDEIIEGREFHLIHQYDDENTCQIHASLGLFINKKTRNNTMSDTFDHTKWLGLIDSDNNRIVIEPYDENGKLDVEKQYNNSYLFYDGREIQVDQICGGNPSVYIDTTYRLKKVEDEEFTYQLVDEDNQVVSLGDEVESMRLSFIVDKDARTTIKMVGIENGAKTFQLVGDHGKVLDLIYYNGRNNKYSAVITDEQVIKAYYLTKPFNMGSMLYEKTIWAWIVANDSELESSVDVGYIHSRKQSVMEVALDTRGFDVRKINFSAIQFTHNKLPHLLVKNKIIPNVNFIRFVFKNSDNSNMVISQFSILYSISHLSKGVK